MPATVDHYQDVAAAFPDTESLTVLAVAGATRDQLVGQLGVDLGAPVEDGYSDEDDVTAWALLEIPGGVLAVELSGFGDPSNDDLAALSRAGAAAVVRSNILAHYRFGCASAGTLAFDADEYTFIDDPDTVPTPLRRLFDLVYDDLDEDPSDSPGDEEGLDPLVVGLAMAEVITGVEITVEHVHAVLDSGFFAAPSGRYLADLADEE